MANESKKPALVIMAAGMGSRYGGIKQIDPVGNYGEVILHYSVYDAVRAGFGKIVFVIRPDIEKDFVEAVMNKIPSSIDATYVFQTLESELPYTVETKRTKPWGTAHATLCSSSVVNTPFAVINADDYYGVEVFSDVIPFLNKMSNDSTAFAMAGYTLSKTLSDNGYVSRGICKTDSDNLLTSIVEWERIERVNGKIAVRHQKDDDPLFVKDDELTSMNFFCLNPVFFEKVRAAFKEFLKDPYNLGKNEIYLPILLGELINKGEATVEVIPTNSNWFGMTYIEDRPKVKSAFKKLIDEGIYPSPLWEMD